MISNKIIPALDTDIDSAKRFLTEFKNEFNLYKIHSLFLKEQFKIVDLLKDRDKKIFLDLKLYDIPKTMVNHLKVLSKFKADWITIHLSNSVEALSESVKVSKDLGIELVGVSVLTSFDQVDLIKSGVSSDIDQQVELLVSKGVAAGITHFVCSASEVRQLKILFPNIVTITPGITLGKTKKIAYDQKRILDLQSALNFGSDWLVIGRALEKISFIEWQEFKNQINIKPA
jgi:orotidine-5'-phosphate decarboxylase